MFACIFKNLWPNMIIFGSLNQLFIGLMNIVLNDIHSYSLEGAIKVKQ